MNSNGVSGSQPFLYPQVSTTRTPGVEKGANGVAEKTSQVQSPEEGPSFEGELNQALLKFSNHAASRMKERKIELSPETWAKVNEAIDKAGAKGVEDTLVLTKDAALIVNVKNRTVVTAVDTGSLKNNVFTHIDGAVIVA